MNNKIDVGEYVRTKDGIIDKVIIEYDGKCNSSNCDEKHISCKYNYYNEKDIVKHSKIISEVVEIGDYVNGKLIHKIDEVPNNAYKPDLIINTKDLIEQQQTGAKIDFRILPVEE